ncbi:hypothetical protein Cgig2_028730 [Carnegiea gigantea]|uniref:Uncharacterized protein n=1 Tax=Carnegiea gigantea TaxID=171969 RepID=A0A9Q1GIT3_9CARY|nr:hypothetical protein Cgig2_028730 [Carnegiea gigantea]
MVLGYIYHGLGEVASHLDHLGKANAIFSSHYVIDRNCPSDFPTLVHYAGLLTSKLSSPQLRHVFMDGRHLSLRASSYREESRNDRDVMNMGLSDKNFKFLLSIRPSQRSIIDLAEPHADIQRRDIEANLKEEWVRGSNLKGVEVIIGIISNHGSARKLLASRVRASQFFNALRSMIDIYKLSTIEICWLSSNIEEIFGVVKTAAKIEALSDQDLTCSSKISRIEYQLNKLSSKASKLKGKEEEVLRDEDRICKMREDLTIQQ